MTLDLATLGGAIASVGAVAGGMYAWWLKTQKDRANVRADVAQADTTRAVADANQSVYKLLNERLTTLEAEVRSQRTELDAERRHSRRLVLHIWKLEGLMRKAGLEPPGFVDEDTEKAD
jgi:uncharacterized protein HemX